MGKILIIKDADFSAVAVNKVTPSGKIRIDAIANPINSGTFTGVGAYDEGDEVILSAHPNSGYVFSQWSDGNTNASRTIIVGSQDVTYTGLFMEASSFKNSDLLTTLNYFLRVENSQIIAAESNNWRYGIYELPNNTSSIYIEELIGTESKSLTVNHCPVVAFSNGPRLTDFISGTEIYGSVDRGAGLYEFNGTIQIPNGATHVIFNTIYRNPDGAHADMDAMITFN